MATYTCAPTTGGIPAWHKAAIKQKAGRITAAGMTRYVTFEAVDGPVNDRIDDAYRAKHRASPYLVPMISARARAATIKVMPRGAGHQPSDKG